MTFSQYGITLLMVSQIGLARSITADVQDKRSVPRHEKPCGHRQPPLHEAAICGATWVHIGAYALRHACTKGSITQVQLAKAMGVSQNRTQRPEKWVVPAAGYPQVGPEAHSWAHQWRLLGNPAAASYPEPAPSCPRMTQRPPQPAASVDNPMCSELTATYSAQMSWTRIG